MGFFDIFGKSMSGKFRKDESEEWPVRGKLPLVMNLRKMSLNDIRLDGPPSDLYKFGRPDNEKPFLKNEFEYNETGCRIEIYDGTIGYFAVGIQNDKYTPFGPTTLDLISPKFSDIKITDETSPEVIHEHLGSPKTTDIDDYEIVEFYETDDYVLEVEYTLEKKVKRVNLYENP